MICYFETSALNYMISNIDAIDADATNKYNKKNEIEFVISPIVIWEILLFGDDHKRESLIFVAQHLLSDWILPSPSEIIIDELKLKMGILKDERTLKTRLDLGNTWMNICKDKRKTFIFNPDDLLSKSEFIRHMSKRIKDHINIIEDDDILPAYDCSDEEMFEYFVNFTIKNNKHFKENLKTNDEDYLTYKLAILFMFYFLILTIDYDSTPIEEFWKELNILDHNDKVSFVISNADKIIQDSFFLFMACMAISQIELKEGISRGLIFDCMHTLYIQYVDIYMTNDKHLINFRRFLDEGGQDKIKLISEYEWNKYPADVDVDGFLKNIKPIGM